MEDRNEKQVAEELEHLAGVIRRAAEASDWKTVDHYTKRVRAVERELALERELASLKAKPLTTNVTHHVDKVRG